MKIQILWVLLLLFTMNAIAQNNNRAPDSTEQWNFHAQLTIIDQSHTSFSAAYSGLNSLSPSSEEALSLTTTLFIGRKLWKNASLYFNPEVSGGSGVSQARGVAGFPNGETFRIGSSAPALYLGRLFLRQYIPLSKESDDLLVESDVNQLKEYVPAKRIVVTAGKLSLSDIFDNNSYSHDPRTQFMNWALMSNGAWDYPANTRGYTDAVALQYINPSWSISIAGSLVPTYANGPELDYNYLKASGTTVEFVKNTVFNKHKGAIRLLLYRNVSKAPAYRDLINNNINKTDTLDATYGKKYGGVKYGFGINMEQELSQNLGMFFRTSYNDGKTATWAFTEIDQSASLGFNYIGKQWKRPDDNIGVAAVVNGISIDHRDFFAHGGYGFIIGDGKVTNYKTENIMEAYYSAKINKNFFVSADYQFVQNPAYNADRGSVNLFSIRAHVVL